MFISAKSLEDKRVGLAISSAPVKSDIYNDLKGLREFLREAMISAGLGSKDPAVPLADIIAPGAFVLLKPNWVLHYNVSGATMDCMVTHPSFITAALAEVIAARPGRVMIADAPIQSANFNSLAPVQWRKHLIEISGKTLLDFVDFRNTIVHRSRIRWHLNENLRDHSRFVEFDLKKDSLLEPISMPEGQFRNTSYDPDHMASVQRSGTHRFLLCKEPFEADVIINLPKLKAHAKAGITAALKNLVGINGDKNYLPHHRVGGSALGGDCYEGLKPFKRIAEWLLDCANRRIGKPGHMTVLRASVLANLVHGGDLEGKWAGNDTTWRMVLDLNRLLMYGDKDGILHDTPQRRIYSLTDGIVAGERNGPLAPEPNYLGAVTFASNSAHADAAHLALMHFDSRKVKLVREAFSAMRYPLANNQLEETEVWHQDRSYTLAEVEEKFGRSFRPPDGWVGRIESQLGQQGNW